MSLDPSSEKKDQVVRLTNPTETRKAERSGKVTFQSKVPPAEEPKGSEEQWGEGKEVALSKKANKSPIWWLSSFVLLAFLGIGVLMYNNHNRNKRADASPVDQGLEKQKSEEKGVQSEVSKEQAEEILARVEQRAADFMSAQSIEDMLPLVRDPNRVLPLMQGHYEKNQLEPKKFDYISDYSLDLIQGKEIHTAVIHAEDGSMYHFCLVEGKDSLKIDWETSVAYQPMDWNEFIEQQIEEPLDFRVNVFPDNYYAFEYEDSEVYHAFKMSTPGADREGIGYIRRDNPDFMKLVNIFTYLQKTNTYRPIAFILTLKHQPNTTHPRGFLIEKVICQRWLMLDESERPSKTP